MPYDPGELTLSSSPDPLHPRAPQRRPGWGGRSAPAGTFLAMDIANLDEREPFTTLDGSTIREIAGRVTLPSQNQSLAEAVVPPGGQTIAHYHRESEELYFFLGGEGRVRVADEWRDVRAGDCVVLPPGVEHKLDNSAGSEPLRLLCCCSPAYSHEDTVLTEEPVAAS
jgi:mannose-6-phosphate isomerase-like protein (cupin superfamily)